VRRSCQCWHTRRDASSDLNIVIYARKGQLRQLANVLSSMKWRGEKSNEMNRRNLLQALLASPLALQAAPTLEVPVLCLTDTNAKCSPSTISQFRSAVWNEAVATFAKCGIRLRINERSGEVRKHPSGGPRFIGLERGKVNIVLTDYVPADWDGGRFSAGVSTVSEGYHLCVISMYAAHGNRIPYLSVNTVAHELLHIFLQDIFVTRGDMIHGYGRESRADWYATRMWLSGEGAPVRDATRQYLARLAAGAGTPHVKLTAGAPRTP